jgi:hypothetical protein
MSIALGSSSTSFYSCNGLLPVSAGTANSFNNTNGARQGLRFQVPFKCRAAGIRLYRLGSANGDFNYILMDDAGTELSSSSTLRTGLYSTTTNDGVNNLYFDNNVTLDPGTWYRAVLEPTSTTNITLYTFTIPSTDYLSATPFGANAHYTTYASSAWNDTATTQLPVMGIIIDQLDDGVSTGGGGGIKLAGRGGLAG